MVALWLRLAALLGLGDLLATSGGKRYADVSYDRMYDDIQALAKAHPRFVRVFLASDAYRGQYGAGVAGTCGSKHRSCEHVVVVVSDFGSLPAAARGAGTAAGERGGGAAPRSNASARAEVFLSGALHGDERVGPLSTFAFLRLLAVGASCAADGVSDPERCAAAGPGERASLGAGAVGAARLRWLGLLARKRVLYAMPMTNPWGFAHASRSEVKVDTNRDFAIDTAPSACAKSATGRVVNELFRRHVFQVGVTFHGGMEAIAYEWGAPSHNRPPPPGAAGVAAPRVRVPRGAHGARGRRLLRGPSDDDRAAPARDLRAAADADISPDDASQRAVAAAMAAVGGAFDGGKPYRHSRMNSIVYPVHGGMEDWAYAASWDAPLAVPGGCAAPGYDRSRTASYDDASNRCFMVLVETSNAKAGPARLFGGDGALFDPAAAGDDGGHVPRNVRLALLALDVAEPYAYWTEGHARAPDPNLACGDGGRGDAPDDVVATAARRGAAELVAAFAVGGALAVDGQETFWGCYDAAAAKAATCRGAEALAASAAGRGADAAPSPARWGLGDVADALGANAGAVRHARLDLAAARAKCGDRGKAWLVAGVAVDGGWGAAPERAQPPGLPPQTHLARARTDASWRKLGHDGRAVLGRRLWFAPPLVVDLAGRDEKPRRRPLSLSAFPTSKPAEPAADAALRGQFAAAAVGVAVLSVAVAALRRRKRAAARSPPSP